MKYRTVIQVTTEADSRKEAMDVVDDYLAGNIVSGIDMTCSTKRVHNYGKGAVAVTLAGVLVFAAVFSTFVFKPSHTATSAVCGIDAVQPALKTSCMAANSADFKKEWEKKHTNEALELIKKVE